jgi:hypothetical protein
MAKLWRKAGGGALLKNAGGALLDCAECPCDDGDDEIPCECTEDMLDEYTVSAFSYTREYYRNADCTDLAWKEEFRLNTGCSDKTLYVNPTNCKEWNSTTESGSNCNGRFYEQRDWSAEYGWSAWSTTGFSNGNASVELIAPGTPGANPDATGCHWVYRFTQVNPTKLDGATPAGTYVADACAYFGGQFHIKYTGSVTIT